MRNWNRKQLTKQYKNLFVEVRLIVNEHDPIGLIAGDAPKDEYDDEIASIMPLLNKGLSLEDLSMQIALIFSKQFGDGKVQSYEPYKPLSKDLMKLMEHLT